MRLCMISPHLPPEQAANALLPVMLGEALSSHGMTTSYLSHPASNQSPFQRAPDVTYVPRRGRDRFSRSTLGALLAGGRMAIGSRRLVSESDLVHLHGNGFIVEIGHQLAERYRKPYVITLYGTDVWHHDPVRHARFARVVRESACRVFYSRGLHEFAQHLGLAPDPSVVIYAPVSPVFHRVEEEERQAIRRDLGAGDGPLLLTVKRLHPVAGHETLLEAMPQIVSRFPDAKLWLIGEGERRSALEGRARALGVASRVGFLGRIDQESLWRYCAAADLFVLPSYLESWGTVMLEALACGTPVVATDTAGGVEVHDRFPDDVTLVEMRNPEALAAAISGALAARRRATQTTEQRLRTEFDVSHCAARYLAVYRQALENQHAI
ncbi:MAG: glycosyltransferase family 4 protein [Acidobacteria bacterium]|nr:glycosyltransferase family 4 protein [Acidobacteriota bacterium]